MFHKQHKTGKSKSGKSLNLKMPWGEGGGRRRCSLYLIELRSSFYYQQVIRLNDMYLMSLSTAAELLKLAKRNENQTKKKKKEKKNGHKKDKLPQSKQQTNKINEKKNPKIQKKKKKKKKRRSKNNNNKKKQALNKKKKKNKPPPQIRTTSAVLPYRSCAVVSYK